VSQQIAAVKADATALEVQGTPAFAISTGNAKPYAITVQSLTPSAFRPALDDALKG
jgi:protein-disulfide isomerase